MATSSYKTFLMQKKENAYEKLVDIKDFPNLGGAPEMLETTTLSDPMQTYIEGIQSQDALEYTINYDLATYQKLLAMKGTETEFAVWFGGDEANGVVTPTGAGSYHISSTSTTWQGSSPTRVSFTVGRKSIFALPMPTLAAARANLSGLRLTRFLRLQPGGGLSSLQGQISSPEGL